MKLAAGAIKQLACSFFDKPPEEARTMVPFAATVMSASDKRSDNESSNNNSAGNDGARTITIPALTTAARPRIEFDCQPIADTQEDKNQTLQETKTTTATATSHPLDTVTEKQNDVDKGDGSFLGQKPAADIKKSCPPGIAANRMLPPTAGTIKRKAEIHKEKEKTSCNGDSAFSSPVNLPSLTISTSTTSSSLYRNSGLVANARKASGSPTSAAQMDGFFADDQQNNKSNGGDNSTLSPNTTKATPPFSLTLMLNEATKNLVESAQKIRSLEETLQKTTREKEQAEAACTKLEAQKTKMIGTLKRRKGILIETNAQLKNSRDQLREQTDQRVSLEAENGELRQGLYNVRAVRDDLRNKLRTRKDATKDAARAQAAMEAKLRRAQIDRGKERELLELYRKLAGHTGYYKWGKQIRSLEAELAAADHKHADHC